MEYAIFLIYHLNLSVFIFIYLLCFFLYFLFIIPSICYLLQLMLKVLFFSCNQINFCCFWLLFDSVIRCLLTWALIINYIQSNFKSVYSDKLETGKSHHKSERATLKFFLPNCIVLINLSLDRCSMAMNTVAGLKLPYFLVYYFTKL